MPQIKDIKTKDKMVSWSYPSHIHYEKSKIWFLFVFLIFLSLSFLFVYLGQYLTVFILILALLVIYIYAKMPPQKISCTISKEGLKIGQRKYSFSQFKSFSILETPFPRLYLETTSHFKPPLSLPLLRQDPASIKRLLSQYLPELPKKEEWTERISRFLKI